MVLRIQCQRNDGEKNEKGCKIEKRFQTGKL